MSCKFCFIENLADRSVALDHAFFCPSLERVFLYVMSEKGCRIVMGSSDFLPYYRVLAYPLYRVVKSFSECNHLRSSYDPIPLGYCILGQTSYIHKLQFKKYQEGELVL